MAVLLSPTFPAANGVSRKIRIVAVGQAIQGSRTTTEGLTMYIPAWPSLSPSYLVPSQNGSPLPFPLSAMSSAYFYVARNSTYHLFRRLGRSRRDTALVPDSHH